MKFTSNTIFALIFTIIAVLVFIMMARRPIVEGDAMTFALPGGTTTSVTTQETTPADSTETQLEADKPVEAPATSAPDAPEESTVPATEAASESEQAPTAATATESTDAPAQTQENSGEAAMTEETTESTESKPE